MTAIATLPVLMQTGNHASRPAASAVGSGALYFCTTHSLIYQQLAGSWGTFWTFSSGFADPMTTRGDVIVRNASNVTARLAVGANLAALRSDGTDVGYAILPGTLLGYKVFSAGDTTTTGSSLADVDATNAAVTFTAPASGNVLVRLSATCSAGNTDNAAYCSWGIRESTSNIAGAVGESIAVRCENPVSSNDVYIGAVKVFVLTGISAGSHTYKWSWAVSAGTARMKANSNSPGIMEVIALA